MVRTMNNSRQYDLSDAASPVRLLFTRGRSRFNRLSAWASRGRLEAPTLATHQEIFATDVDVVGATFSGVRSIPWPTLRINLDAVGTEWTIARYTGEISDMQRGIVDAKIVEMLGPPPWKYSYAEIALQLVDGLIAKLSGRKRLGLDAYVFRRFGDLWERGVICSRTANRPLVAVSILPRFLRHGAPDDTLDYIARSPVWKIEESSPGFFPESGETGRKSPRK
jgi:hypothetical protein